jgi:hypothetical protein
MIEKKKQINQYVFADDLALSQEYEKKFGQYLSQLGVKDVAYAPKDNVFEEWDVCAGDIKYEIKVDRWMGSTGNFCIETHSCREKNSLGWFFKTKANIIVVFYNTNEFVFIPTKLLQNAWLDQPHIWTKKEIKQSWGTTICWLANCKEIPGIQTGGLSK